MYDLYYMGRLLKHFDESDFYIYKDAIQMMCRGSHWEELFDVPVSRAFVFRGDVDGKITFRLVKD